MSICVAFNLSDGVVIAVDSATTMIDGNGNIANVHLDVDKLFQLGGLRVGIATYGVASLHDGRTIGSFIREFTLIPENGDLAQLPLSEIVERLRAFFFDHYKQTLEAIHSLPFEQIEDSKKGDLGLIVGGFSSGGFQSELWQIVVPKNETPNSASIVYQAGNFGVAWFASAAPITRYIKGIDNVLSIRVRTLFQEILGRDLSDDESRRFASILAETEYPILTAGMPIQSGIACARFLVDFVLGHYRFAETHPIVGGKARIGTVTYSQNAFQILD
jgi:hypothetical protein